MPMTNTTPVVTETTQQDAAQGGILTIIDRATQSGASVETLERLMALHERWQAAQAKRAFDAAMAAAQGEMPIIAKTKAVANKGGASIRYRYAPLEAIVDQTRAVLSRNGLSYSITVNQDQTTVEAVCTAKHVDGHSESTAFRVPIDPEAYMSGPQKFAAALTYAKRYAFCNAFGIMTGDDDTDASPESVGETAQNTPTPADMWTDQGHGVCRDCGAANKIGKAGKPYCGALCWKMTAEEKQKHIASRPAPATAAPTAPQGATGAAKPVGIHPGTLSEIRTLLAALAEPEERLVAKVGRPLEQLSDAGGKALVAQLRGYCVRRGIDDPTLAPTTTPAAGSIPMASEAQQALILRMLDERGMDMATFERDNGRIEDMTSQRADAAIKTIGLVPRGTTVREAEVDERMEHEASCTSHTGGGACNCIPTIIRNN